MNIYLIDYENVHDSGLEGVRSLGPQDKVIVFYGEKIKTISFDRHIEMMTSKASVEYIETGKIAKNYLDFQLATYLGYIVGTGQNAVFYIISNDTGFDSVVDFWKRKNRQIVRQATISGDRGKKKPEPKPETGAVKKPESKPETGASKKPESKPETGASKKPEQRPEAGAAKNPESNTEMRAPVNTGNEALPEAKRNAEAGTTGEKQVQELKEGLLKTQPESPLTLEKKQKKKPQHKKKQAVKTETAAEETRTDYTENADFEEKTEPGEKEIPKEKPVSEEKTDPEAEKAPEKNAVPEIEEAQEEKASSEETTKPEEKAVPEENTVPEIKEAPKNKASEEKAEPLQEAEEKTLKAGSPANKEKPADISVFSESYRKKVRQAVKQDNLSVGCYTVIYRAIVSCKDKLELNNCLVKAFASEKGGKIYNQIKSIFEEYLAESKKNS